MGCADRMHGRVWRGEEHTGEGTALRPARYCELWFLLYFACPTVCGAHQVFAVKVSLLR